MIGGMCGIVRDVIPYGLVMGGPRSGLAGLNLIGLQRQGVAKEDIITLQQAYKTLFNKEDATPFAERLQALAAGEAYRTNALVRQVIDFVLHPSKNNILQPD